MSRLEIAVGQITQAREYTQSLIDSITPQVWFQQPSEGVTHIAWQVGHLAVAEYSLALRRIRGEQPGDAALCPEEMRHLFGRGSQPSADPGDYPSPAEILLLFESVHLAVLDHAESLTDAELDEPTEPHRVFNDKLGALLWCARHEMLHAGQIGLLRRLLGHEAVW